MSPEFVFVGLILLLVGYFVIRITYNTTMTKRRNDARAAYDQALAALKHDPTNPDLKQEVLAIGRAYAKFTRDKNGVAQFNEMTLSNDIGAATASATRTSAPPPLTMEQRLRQLDELKAKGLVGEHEYEERRRAILESL